MPDSRIVQIHKKLVSLISVNYATGYTGLDLSGRVIRGLIEQPAYIPAGCVNFVDVDEKYGPSLGRYSADAIFEIALFVGGSDEEERGDNAINLVSDAISKITENRQLDLASLVDDVKCSYTAIEGEKFGLNNIGIGYIRVVVKFQSSDGT